MRARRTPRCGRTTAALRSCFGSRPAATSTSTTRHQRETCVAPLPRLRRPAHSVSCSVRWTGYTGRFVPLERAIRPAPAWAAPALFAHVNVPDCPDRVGANVREVPGQQQDDPPVGGRFVAAALGLRDKPVDEQVAQVMVQLPAIE